MEPLASLGANGPIVCNGDVMLEAARHDLEEAQLLALGISRAEARRLVDAGASYEEVRHLVQDIGCPPSLAAELLLWARELEGERS